MLSPSTRREIADGILSEATRAGRIQSAGQHCLTVLETRNSKLNAHSHSPPDDATRQD
jgi:hypothetical protein